MSWSAIEADEVLQEFNPAEQEKIAKIQGAEDNLTPILNRVVNAARGSIVVGGNRLGPAGTIPDQVREDVIAIARWRWIISLPAADDKALQSDARKAAHDDAMKRLDKIATGEPKVELPDDPIATTSPSNAIELASSQPRKATAAKLDGL